MPIFTFILWFSVGTRCCYSNIPTGFYKRPGSNGHQPGTAGQEPGMGLKRDLPVRTRSLSINYLPRDGPVMYLLSLECWLERHSSIKQGSQVYNNINQQVHNKSIPRTTTLQAISAAQNNLVGVQQCNKCIITNNVKWRREVSVWMTLNQ